MGEPVRGVAQQVRVYTADAIPLVGFGTTELTTREPNGGLGTVFQVRCFVLACGCLVDEPQRVAPPCTACLDAVLASPPPAITPAGLVFLAMPCVNHYRRCQAPYCPTAGGCTRHVAPGPDGLYYCEPHHEAVSRAADVAAVEAAQGPLASRVYAALQSFFHL